MAMVSRNGVPNTDVTGRNGKLLRNFEVSADDVKRIVNLTRECRLGWVLDVEGHKATAYVTAPKESTPRKSVMSLDFEYYQQETRKWERLHITVKSGDTSKTFHVDNARASKELNGAVNELHDLLYSGAI